jgi:uncharacterized membrane protein YphA (DoxX/SURF4 family)|tara:strand:- start:35 stop:304 length:270 start_codon:yes stop_codon:yes gene_type:complete
MSKLFHNKNNDSNTSVFESWNFSAPNYILFGIGVALIIVGYLIMATGEVNSFQSLTLAPIMLFIGYIIVIPAALIYRGKSPEVEENLGS